MNLSPTVSVPCSVALVMLCIGRRFGLYSNLGSSLILVCGHGLLGNYRIIWNWDALCVTSITELLTVLILIIRVMALIENCRLFLFILRLCLTRMILNLGLGRLSRLFSTPRQCGLNSCSGKGTRGNSIEFSGNTGTMVILLVNYYGRDDVTGLGGGLALSAGVGAS